MRTDIWHSRNVFCKCHLFGYDRSIITGTVLEDQCFLSTVSSLSLEGFS